jgi:preprotein translocase subunit SecD
MVLHKEENRMKLSWRIWLLIIVLLLSTLAISPSFEKGVVIKSVEQNSTAYEEGLRSGLIIKSINNNPVNNIDDYTKEISSIFPVENSTKLSVGTKDSEIILFTKEPPEITVSNIPRTRIKTGLDLSGGARALVKPEVKVSASELNDLITITNNRLNTFGISDVSVKPVTDLSGNNFMLVEVAGATPSDLKELVSKQGKFEAKIGNETVFIGGEKDITYVARTGEQSGIYSCNTFQEGEFCNFRFTISLSEQAAKRHANITGQLGINISNPEYLEKQLDLYLDEKLVESLYIGRDLKGSETTQIMISGSGSGTTRKEAYDSAMNNMKHLQTILITGSLPYKLEIVKLDTISPSLGKEFTKNIMILALFVFFAVSVALFIKYRKIKITLAVILTMFSEAFVTLAVAALIKWNLDAPGIAGIIAGMGTGVNDQIVILDEAVSDKTISLKERIKNALFIIFGAFFTIIAAMLPLFWAGAGMLKGFALTTIIGVSVGILITRPAFAEIVKMILKD